MHPLLENRRNDAGPKCANCGWWKGRDTSAGQCDRHGIKTLDLMVCSDHRDNDPVTDILEPEHEDDIRLA